VPPVQFSRFRGRALPSPWEYVSVTLLLQQKVFFWQSAPSSCGVMPSGEIMSFQEQPNIQINNTPDFRETYANSVQVRMSVWDFYVAFGTLQPQTKENQFEVRNFQGIYLSPQQAKALSMMLQQNVANYEQTFGEIKLDPQFGGGQVH
jgi:hypothetical protein